ncbi:shikimate dehydrogenase [Microbacteriaceae bacterium VKM Ac-2854]|nr:shikimate dehydrogenase [Microbacteriaceae bacterium VKM Ac-2854]
MTTGPVTRLAVLGSPIGHSRSPLLHAAAYRELGLDWNYAAVEIDETTLADFVASRDDSWRGLSLTMPLKVAVLPLLAEQDFVARATGAVNTVLFERTDGLRLRGFNTDVTGIVRALAEEGLASARHVEVLGGGATAASAVAAAAELGAERVIVTVRAPERAAALIEVGRAAGVAVDIRSFAEWSTGAELVISTLPGGASSTLVVPADLPASSTLFDVAYSPWPSPLGTVWSAAGSPVVSGLSMLLHQALVQVRIFVAGDPAVAIAGEAGVLAAMRAVVNDRSVPES